MKLVYKVENNTAKILDTDKKDKTTCKVSELSSRKMYVDNVNVYGNKLQLVGGDFRRLYDDKVQYQVYGRYITRSGDFKGYVCVDSKGEIKTFCIDEMFKLYRSGRLMNCGVMDGRLIVRFRKLEDVVAKTAYTMSSDEYFDLYNRYNRLNLLNNSTNVVDIFERDRYGLYHKSNYADDTLHQFMNRHKYMKIVLSKAKLIRLVEIPEKFEIRNGEVESFSLGKKDRKMLLTYELFGVRRELLFLLSDKCLKSVVVNREMKQSRLKGSDLVKLVSYRWCSEDSCTSKASVIEIANRSKEDTFDIEKLEDGIYTCKGGVLENMDSVNRISFRGNILLGCSDIVFMYNMLNKS